MSIFVVQNIWLTTGWLFLEVKHLPENYGPNLFNPILVHKLLINKGIKTQ